MIKDELKKLSEEIFFDNTSGGITPQQQRRFYQELIDKVVTSDEVMNIDLSEVQSDVIPTENLSQNLGSAQKTWNNLHANTIYTSGINGVNITDQGDCSGFLSEDGTYRELNSGWNEIRENSASSINNQIDWCVIGDSLILTGFLDSGSVEIPSFSLSIPEKYLKRIKRNSFFTLTDMVKDDAVINRGEIRIEAVENELRIKPVNISGILKIYLNSLIIPLKREDTGVIPDLKLIETGNTGLPWEHYVVYGNDSFILMNGGGEYVMLSNNFIWKKGDIGLEAFCLTYGKELFFVGSYMSFYAISSDGINWQNDFFMGLGADPRAVAYGNGIFVVAAQNGISAVTESPTSEVWTESDMGLLATALIYGNGIFMAVGNNAQASMSTDGINWTVNNIGTSVSMISVAYGNDLFVAVGYKECAITSDGQNWTKIEIGIEDMCSVAYGNGLFVVIAKNAKYAWSADGINWQIGETGLTETLSKITYGNGLFVAVGYNGNYAILEIV